MRTKIAKNDPTVQRILRTVGLGNWRGRKVYLETALSHRVWDFWDGGSRDYTYFVNLETWQALTSDALPKKARQQAANPFGLAISKEDVSMVPGVAVIVHRIFCGKDAGVTIIVHPDNMAKLLPSPQLEVTNA
jgi:hypothetical protein